MPASPDCQRKVKWQPTLQIQFVLTAPGVPVRISKIQVSLQGQWPTVRHIFYLLSLLLLYGCANDLTDIAFIDELKHPTKFPDIYRPDVLDIEKLIAENPLKEDEKIKVVPLGETRYASILMLLVRSGVEVPTHYHKGHDEVIHVKRGSAIVILDGTRYYVEPGEVILVPRKSHHKVMNTGREIYAAISVFYPPYRGEDIKFVKEKKKKVRKRKLE